MEDVVQPKMSEDDFEVWLKEIFKPKPPSESLVRAMFIASELERRKNNPIDDIETSARAEFEKVCARNGVPVTDEEWECLRDAFCDFEVKLRDLQAQIDRRFGEE